MYSLIVIAIFLSSFDTDAFESGMLPGEGHKRILAAADEVTLHHAPSSCSSIAKKLRINRGAEIKFNDVRFRTIKPGLFVAERPGSLEGTDYGPISYLSEEDYIRFRGNWKRFIFSEGDTIQYLQYRTEGSGFVRFRGQVIGAELLSKKSLALVQTRDPIVEIWIRVTDDEGVSIGWYRVDDDTVRRFHPRRAYPWPRKSEENQK